MAARKSPNGSSAPSALEERVRELEAANEDLGSLLRSTEIATVFLDSELRIRRFTPAATPLLNVIQSDIGRPIGKLSLRVDDPDLAGDIRRVLTERRRQEKEVRSLDGGWFLRRANPLRTPEGRIAGVVVTFSDVSALKETAARLALREKQQAAIARIGRLALSSSDLTGLFQHATRVVADTLDCEFCKVLEHKSEEKQLWLRAGVGWSPGLVGHASVSAGVESQGGFTLESRSPVIVDDLRTERRFHGPALLTDHGVVSGMSVVLGDEERPWGVLGVHSTRRIEFTTDDVNFLQSVAHVISSAIRLDETRRDLLSSRERLAAQYRELEAVYHQTPVGLAVMDRNLRFVRANEVIAQLNGIAVEETLGKRVTEVVPGELGEQVEALMRRTIETGESEREVELEGTTAADVHGRRHWRASYHPLLRDGEAEGVICVVRETTRQHFDEARIAAEHGVARVLSLAETFTDAIPGVLEAFAAPFCFDVAEFWTRRPDSDELECSALWATDSFGFRESWEGALEKAALEIGEGLVGHVWKESQPRWIEDLAREVDFRRRDVIARLGISSGGAFPAISGGEVIGVLAFFGREAFDGSVAFCETMAQIGNETGHLWRRTRAEAALRESEELFRITVEEAPIPVIRHAFDGAVLGVNAAFTRATGYTNADLPEKRTWMRELLRIPADEIDERLARLYVRLRTPEDFPEPEEVDVYSRKGEKRRWRLYRCPPMRTSEGRQFSTTMAVDLTDRRLFEEELAKARDSAEAASRLKSAFLANVSHEIRTPMTAIIGHTELLGDEVDDVEALRKIETIKRNGLYLVEIIDDILDLSKIEADRLDLEFERVHPQGVLTDVASLMRARAVEKDLTLRVDYEGPIPETIETDPTRLRQILINLVGNAVKFTEQGGVRIAVRMDDAEPERLRIEVIDTGVGVEAALRETIFEPFIQGRTAPSGARGSGLGLAISKRLAGLLRGELSLTNRPEGGSIFSLAIPTGSLAEVPMIEAEGALGDLAEEPQRRLPDLRSARVLVVDDHEDIRDLVRGLLERCGAVVTTAGDGQQAFEAAEAEDDCFDLVVLDMQMPVQDGYATARRLRDAGFSAPILALTAAAMSTDRDRCLQAGCSDYLPKPIDRGVLLQKIRAALSDTEPGSESRRQRILLVEDDEDSRLALEMLLERRHGAAVHAVGSAAAALEIAERERFSVALLDLTLPDMDGFALLAALRKLEGLSGAVFVALTGRSEEGIADRIERSGFAHMVRKPVLDITELTRFFPPMS